MAEKSGEEKHKDEASAQPTKTARGPGVKAPPQAKRRILPTTVAWGLKFLPRTILPVRNENCFADTLRRREIIRNLSVSASPR
jgi:hypothetical protein